MSKENFKSNNESRTFPEKKRSGKVFSANKNYSKKESAGSKSNIKAGNYEKTKTADRPESGRRNKDIRRTGAAGKTKVKTKCPYSGKCGGCTMIDVPMEEQLKKKQAFVEECIGEFGKVDPIVRMKNPYRYRNKVTSIFGLDIKGHPVCGVYKEHSHDIVPVKDCLIEDKKADAIIQTIFSMLPSFKLRVYDEDTGLGLIRAVQVRTGRSFGEIMVTIVTNGPQFPSKNNFVKALLDKHPEITTIVQNINDRNTSMILGDREKVIYGKGYISDRICGKTFRISSRSFYQINPVQTEKLYNIAIDCAGLSGKEKVMDAYCGTGTIGICASDRASEVISCELNSDACRDAEINIKLNDVKNVTVFNEDAGEFIAKIAQQDAMNAGADTGNPIDVLIMDPPRSGASEEFLDTAAMLMPPKIVYVSCNPETLGRDIAILEESGYRMKKAVPVDMFPNTQAVETVCLLSKLSGTKKYVEVELD